jgi:hypothetical protein
MFKRKLYEDTVLLIVKQQKKTPDSNIRAIKKRINPAQ